MLGPAHMLGYIFHFLAPNQAGSINARLPVVAGYGLLAATLLASTSAQALAPELSNVRNLALADASRASSTGSQAIFINPSGLTYTQQFSSDALYQVNLDSNSHSFGASIQDSLNNPRFAVGLAYATLKGNPEVEYLGADSVASKKTVEHFGHHVALNLSFIPLRNWLHIGTNLKWQYASFRYRDDQDKGQQLLPSLNTFGLDVGATLELLGFARIAVVGYNLVGSQRAAFDEDHPITLTNVALSPKTVVGNLNVPRVADYPLAAAYGVAIMPFRTSRLSINYDGNYDFTSYYKSQNKVVRKQQSVGAEFIAGPVPIRAGFQWDSRGKGKDDDRMYVGGGLGYFKPASTGNTGFEVSASVLQQVSGSNNFETRIGVLLGMRFHPAI